MMIQTDRALFVYDEDNSEYHREYRTEVDLQTLVITEENNGCAKFYQLFREYKEKRRTLRERLYSTSQLQKMKNFINDYLKR